MIYTITVVSEDFEGVTSWGSNPLKQTVNTMASARWMLMRITLAWAP